MLVLSRKESEKIMLGDDVVLTIVRISGDRVRLGIEAPSDMLILRKELDPEEISQAVASSKSLSDQSLNEDQKKVA